MLAMFVQLRTIVKSRLRYWYDGSHAGLKVLGDTLKSATPRPRDCCGGIPLLGQSGHRADVHVMSVGLTSLRLWRAMFAFDPKRTCALPGKPERNSIILPASVCPMGASQTAGQNGPRSPHSSATMATSVLSLTVFPSGGYNAERNDNCCSQIPIARRGH